MAVNGVLFLLCYLASFFPLRGHGHGPFVDPELEWRSLESAVRKQRAPVVRPGAEGLGPTMQPGVRTTSRPRSDFLRVPASADNKAAFSPEKGARAVPGTVKEILLATPSPAAPTAAGSPLIEALCHLDRIYVRVRRDHFNTKTAYKYLKLGSCVVNGATEAHYYFLYLRQSPCGFSQQSSPDYVAVNVAVQFSPDSPVVWEVPFDVPLQCRYHRIHHVYLSGIHPKLKGGTVFKKLTAKAIATIIPQDAAGNVLTSNKTYAMGEPMYFEAKLTGTQSAGQRLYVNKCYMTPSQDPSSTPKYIVIDNQGCMIDGIITEQAKFLKDASKMSLKFSLGAFVFKDMTATPGTPKKIYMHCEISAGPLTATASAKSCNYQTGTKKWRELYDNDAVCSCCDSSCLVQTKASKLMYTSSPLEVDDGLDLEFDSQSGNDFLGSSGDDWKSSY